MASCSGAFREPKNAAEERKLIENDTQSQQVQSKSSLGNDSLTKIQYSNSWVQRLDFAIANVNVSGNVPLRFHPSVAVFPLDLEAL